MINSAGRRRKPALLFPSLHLNQYHSFYRGHNKLNNSSNSIMMANCFNNILYKYLSGRLD